MIVEPRFKGADKATMAAKEKQAEAERQTFIKLGEGDYQLPSIQLLNYDADGAEHDRQDRDARAVGEAHPDARELRRQG